MSAMGSAKRTFGTLANFLIKFVKAVSRGSDSCREAEAKCFNSLIWKRDADVKIHVDADQ